MSLTPLQIAVSTIDPMRTVERVVVIISAAVVSCWNGGDVHSSIGPSDVECMTLKKMLLHHVFTAIIMWTIVSTILLC